MGFLGGIIVGIVGLVIAFVLNIIPVDTFLKIVPICWIPGTNCSQWYDHIKTYVVVILLAIIIFFIPFA